MRLTMIGSFAAAMLASTACAQEQYDLTDPHDVLMVNRKIQCSTHDSNPVTYYWNGYAFSRRQGERDRRLFRVEGMNVRQCVSIDHPEYGEGYQLVTREILLYLDPETNEILSEWENPWTGETVEVLHVANDPVNNTSYVNGPRGPARWHGQTEGDGWWMTFTVPLFYPNPLASEFEAEIGGTYHATEMFNFFGQVDDLLDRNTHTADAAVGWVRISDWLPWMKMNGREGEIYMSTAGRKLESWDDLPDFFKQDIRTHYPEYTDPPAGGDDRANMTSWKYYLGVANGEIEAPDRRSD